jgi:hypothetical protein
MQDHQHNDNENQCMDPVARLRDAGSPVIAEGSDDPEYQQDYDDSPQHRSPHFSSNRAIVRQQKPPGTQSGVHLANVTRKKPSPKNTAASTIKTNFNVAIFTPFLKI